jgi:4-amino-4-deoxy-L-arabinose transferase-like glycosyltransferase
MSGAFETVHERNRISIWFVLVLALVIRLAIPIFALALTQNPKVFHGADTSLYLNPALSLIQTGKFSTSPDNPTPEITRPPGYPLFLLPGLMAGKVELLAISVQILLSCFTVYLIYRIALLLFARNSVGVLCALLYAVEPLSVIFTSQLMTETLFTTILAFSIFFLLKYLESDNLIDLLVAGFAMALSAFVRPVSTFLPLWSAMLLLIAGWIRRINKLKLTTCVIVFLSASMLPIFMWQARNRIETGYSGFSAIYDVDMYWGVAAVIQARLQGRTAHQQQLDMGFTNWDKYLEQHPEQRLWGRAKLLQHWRSEGIKTILSEPICFLTLYLESQVKFLFAPGAGELSQLFAAIGSFQSPEFAPSPDLLIAGKGIIGRQLIYVKHWPVFFWTGAILVLWQFAYLLLFAIAVLSKNFFTLPLTVVLAIALFFMAMFFDVGSPYRFRLPIMPIICLFAGYGLSLVIGGAKGGSN